MHLYLLLMPLLFVLVWSRHQWERHAFAMRNLTWWMGCPPDRWTSLQRWCCWWLAQTKTSLQLDDHDCRKRRSDGAFVALESDDSSFCRKLCCLLTSVFHWFFLLNCLPVSAIHVCYCFHTLTQSVSQFFSYGFRIWTSPFLSVSANEHPPILWPFLNIHLCWLSTIIVLRSLLNGPFAFTFPLCRCLSYSYLTSLWPLIQQPSQYSLAIFSSKSWLYLIFCKFSCQATFATCVLLFSPLSRNLLCSDVY